MISAVVLSHNDEQCIEATLKNLLWCDEIILIDDYSKDKTRTIAKKYHVKIIRRHLDDNFASQRNFGLSKAKNEWVLFVDSDEIISPQLASEIQKIVKQSTVANQQLPIGYYLRRRDRMWDRWLTHGETSVVRLLRFGRKNAGIWIRPIHEIWDIKGPTGELAIPILHYPHSNVREFINEINHYSSVNARYLFSKGVSVNVWQIIGYPFAKFVVNYFWHLGILDGVPGAILAICMSFHSFLTRAKLYALWQKRRTTEV